MRPVGILGPGAPGQRATALVIDAAICALVLGVGLLVATEVARARGARGMTAVTANLDWRHALLAVAVLVTYRIGAQWLAGQTPGQALAARPGGPAGEAGGQAGWQVGRAGGQAGGQVGERAGSRPAGRRSLGPALGPTLVALALTATVVGTTVPVDAADGGTGRNGAGNGTSAGTASTAPTAPATGTPVPGTPPGDAPGTGAQGTGAQGTGAQGTGAQGTAAPAPESARGQAVAIDTLLTVSTRSRAGLNAAIGEVDSCADPEGAISTLLRVSNERGDQIARARAMRVDLLPNGEQIRHSLIEVLSRSHDADRAFTAWARNVAANGCGHDQNYAAGRAASDLAQGAKKRFVQLWNPVAASFGLPARSQTKV